MEGGRRHALSQVALVVGAVDAYELLRRLLTPDWPLAIRHAREVASLERLAHLAWEAPLQRTVLDLPPLVQALNAFYLAGNLVVTGGFFVWLYRRSPDAYRRFRDGFVVATALSLVVYWRFPAAPPRLAGVGVVDTLRRFSGIDIGSPGSAALTDPVAAIPSLHAGWAVGVGVGLVLHARTRRGRVAGALYPPAVVVTIVATGNHFLLDAAAGAVVLGLGFALCAVIRRARAVVHLQLRRGVEQPGSSPGS